MKGKITIAAILLGTLGQGLIAQPLVYNKENTGTACTPPPLPAFSQLSAIKPLPDPFLWADGSGRSTSFSDWECRRNEIKAQIENYEIGPKGPTPSRDSIQASFTPNATGGTLRVIIKNNGQTLTITSAVLIPAGVTGPIPAIIGMNSSSGSVPATVFTSRNIARITFSHNNVTTYGNPQNTDPYYRLYPQYNINSTGQYSAWAWGVSRIIDGIEMAMSSIIDVSHIGVTGCSYAGKMALYSGAFDERIALTIAQESGGGGAPSWRASHLLEKNGDVEKIDNTDYNWFKEDMRQFQADNVYKLPHDHHELMAMVAPRALLVTGNTDFLWLSNQSCYVSSRAAKEVYKTLGIADRMGFYIDGGHGHCAVPAKQVPAMQAFVDKFLAGMPDVNTDTITVNPFPNLDYERWYKWWGTGRPILPDAAGSVPAAAASNIWLEGECATVGSQWQTRSDDANASRGAYVVANEGVTNPTAPTDPAASVIFPFVVDKAGSYNVWARVNPAETDFNLWTKVDDSAFSAPSRQYILNPGFENGFTSWAQGFYFQNSTRAIITVADSVHSGAQALRVVCNNTTGTNYHVQIQTQAAIASIVKGKKYEFSYWVRANKAGSIAIQTATDYANTSPDVPIGTEWQQVKWVFTAGAPSQQMVFLLGKIQGVAYYIDDVNLKEVGGNEWIWTQLKGNVSFTAGSHSVSIANLQGAAKLDKILLTSSTELPAGKGTEGTNCPCSPIGNTLFVNAAINNSGSNGASWGCAMPQLSTAIAYAGTHPEIKSIWVAKGTYKPGDTRASSFNINRSDLKILGGFDGSESDAAAAKPDVNRTIISSDIGVAGVADDNCYHAFIISGIPANGTLEINGFEVRDGYADLAHSSGRNDYGDFGGAAVIYGNDAKSNIVFRQMKFVNNTAAVSGGALHVDATDIKVYDSKFSNNKAVTGGAVFSLYSAPAFVHAVFEDNYASQTGGAYSGSFGSASFNKSTFAYNASAQSGGAVYQNQFDASYFNTIFASNRSVQGGAVFQYNNSDASIVNSTFYANAVAGANANGGALVMGAAASRVDISNSIFYANSRAGMTSGSGADISNLFPAANKTSTFINNMLQTGSWVPTDNGTSIANNKRGVNPVFANAPIASGGDLLWATADDGLQLKAGSPAVNSGANAAASGAGLTEDIMDNARICSTVDMGAYEQACDDNAPITRSDAGMYKMETPGIKALNTGLVANPFSSDLQIRYSGTEKCAASIFDGNGRAMVSGRSISQGVNHVDASMWNRGMYQVMLVTQSGQRMLFKAMKL